MKMRLGWLVALMLTALVVGVTCVRAQEGTPPPTAEPSPAPTATLETSLTPTSELQTIQPTPEPSTPNNLWREFQQVWDDNRDTILLTLITALVTGVIVGVFFKNVASKISEWLGRFFHFLFDRFASVPILRWKYENAYRTTLSEAVQHLQGQNIVSSPREIRLETMYVPSLLTEELRPDLGEDFVDRFRTREEVRRRQEKRAVDPWEAVRRFQRFVVLGGPGAGKTTYLYHLTYSCALRRQSDLRDHIPIFIRLREIVEDIPQTGNLEEIFPKIFARYDFPNAEPFIQRRLQEGRFLVLLDGLDEVSNEDDQDRLIALVQDFADRQVRRNSPNGLKNILVVSSRKYSYEHGRQLNGFTKTEVMEFDAPAIEQFVHNWFSDEDGHRADELISELKANKRFMELAANPLLLLLITDHYDRERHLPELRAELYEHCVRTRITRWNEIRGTHRGRFGENLKWRMLRQLALHLFEHEKDGLISHTDLLDWMEDFAKNLRLPKDTTAEDLLEEVVRSSGLIQEWAIDRYGFSHLTLQEFFAAQAVDRLGAEKGAMLLEDHLTDPAWKEVILLYSGLADNANPLLERIVQHARQTEGSKNLWVLAARCMSEGAQQVSDGLRKELADALIELLRFKSDKQRLTPEESDQIIESLHFFASDLLPHHVATLLQSDISADLFLAQRLLTDATPDDLRNELGRRLEALASTADRTEDRQAAVAALGRLGGKDAASIQALLANLQDVQNPATRAEAAMALGRLGQVDDDVALMLQHVYETAREDDVRHAALEALLALRREDMVDMVFIPAGEFLMGSTDADKAARDSEKPQHTLYLPAYFIDRTPVTNAQYRRFIEAGGYANPDYWREAIAAGRWRDGKYIDYDGEHRDRPLLWDDPRFNDDSQPVVGVTWYEALAYSRWAGKRLPNEAEWEKAARGTDGRIYPWGDVWREGRANTAELGIRRTTPVGRFSPEGDSPYGAVDMAGNVWEWCSTRWGFDYPYTPNDGREDLGGGDDVGRVLRGGSWWDNKAAARCAARYRNNPRDWDSNRGFRCCATSSLSGSES